MKEGYQRDMARLILGTVCRPDRRGVLLDIPCTAGHVAEHRMNSAVPPQGVSRLLQQAGWILAHSKATCPEHAIKEKTVASTPNRTETAVMAPTPASIAEQSAAAKRVHRAVMEALMSVYDDDGKSYTGGYTDAKVADETGAATEYVRKVREDYFGPIAQPGEIDGLRKSIDELRAGIATITSDSTAAVHLLTKKADGIEATLASLIRKNGWTL